MAIFDQQEMKQIGMQHHVCILSNMRDQTQKGAKMRRGFHRARYIPGNRAGVEGSKDPE